MQVCRCIPIDTGHRHRQLHGSEGATLHNPNTSIPTSALHSQTFLQKRKNEEPRRTPPRSPQQHAPPAQNDVRYSADTLICAVVAVIRDPSRPGHTMACEHFLACNDSGISWSVHPFAIDIPRPCKRYCACVSQAGAERWRLRGDWNGRPPRPREPHRSILVRSIPTETRGESILNLPKGGKSLSPAPHGSTVTRRTNVHPRGIFDPKPKVPEAPKEGWIGWVPPPGQVRNTLYERSAAAKATTTVIEKNCLICLTAYFHNYPDQGDTSTCEDFMACEEGRLIMTRRAPSHALTDSAQWQCERNCRCASMDAARRWGHRHGWAGLNAPSGSVDSSIYARSPIPKKWEEVPNVLRCNAFVIREFPTRYHSRRCSELMGCKEGNLFQRTDPQDGNVMRQCSNQCRCLTQEAARARDAEAMDAEVEGGYVHVHGEGPRPRSRLVPRSPVPKDMDVLPSILRCNHFEIAHFPTDLERSTCSDLMGCRDGGLYQRRGPQQPIVMVLCSNRCRCLTQEEARRWDLNTVSMGGGSWEAGEIRPRRQTDAEPTVVQSTRLRVRLRPRSALAKNDHALPQPYHLRCEAYSVADYPRPGETNTCQDIVGCLQARVIHKYGPVSNEAWKSCVEHCMCVSSQRQVAMHFHPEEPERGIPSLALPPTALRPSSSAHSRRDGNSRVAYPIHSTAPSTHGPQDWLDTALAKRGLIPFPGSKNPRQQASSAPFTLPLGSRSPDPKKMVLSPSTFEPVRATTHDVRCAYYPIYLYTQIGRECQAFMGCFEGRVVQKNGPESAFVQARCVSICNCGGAAPAAWGGRGARGGRGQRGRVRNSGGGGRVGGEREGGQGGAAIVGDEHRWRSWWAGRIQLR